MIADKNAIEALFNSGVSRYRISKDTGLSAPLLQKYANGTSKIGNMSLDNAITLTEYYNQILEEEKKMNTITFESKEYTLTQEAYMAGTHDAPHFEAHAVDADGNEYMVQWDVRDNWREMDDQSDMCDWDNPASVDAL